MTRKVAAVVLAAVFFLTACSTQKSKDTKNVANLPEKEIRDLSSAIKNASAFRDRMRKKLNLISDSVRQTNDDAEKCRLYLSLAVTFRPINTDSALYYASKAYSLSAFLDNTLRQRAAIATVDALSTAGLFTEASSRFKSLDASSMEPATRLDYWTAGRRLYGYMKSYAHGNTDLSLKYNEYYQQYDDSLLANLPPESDFRTFLQCERLVTERHYREAREILERLLSSLPQESNLYGMAAFQLAEVWKNLGDESRYAATLALSALSDVEGCVSEGLALPTLADWLYQNGELQNAFEYINFALEEASSGNARMRAVTIARFVPVIDEAYQEKINRSRDQLMVYFILVTILFFATVLLIIFLVKQVRKSKANTLKLEQTARRQESYIGNFIGLYSGYADRFNRFSKMVAAKLATGQVAELKKILDSGKFSDGDNDDIHKVFDSAFLDIYPDFIGRINTLLRPDEAVTVKEAGTLTPELRIYAFVKMGIDESTRIAQILHYSINTVYTYRNKMRNKAIVRDTFDTDVKNL